MANSTYTDDLCSIADNDINITVSFEAPDGTRTEWSQLEPTLGAVGSQEHLRTLLLDCLAFPLQVGEFNGEGDANVPVSMGSPGPDAKTSLRVVGDVTGHFYPLCKGSSWGPNQSRQGRLIGVPICFKGTWSVGAEPQRLFVLVVYKQTEFWERVSHFEWSNPEVPTDFWTFLNTVRTTRMVLRIA